TARPARAAQVPSSVLSSPHLYGRHAGVGASVQVGHLPPTVELESDLQIANDAPRAYTGGTSASRCQLGDGASSPHLYGRHPGHVIRNFRMSFVSAPVRAAPPSLRRMAKLAIVVSAPARAAPFPTSAPALEQHGSGTGWLRSEP